MSEKKGQATVPAVTPGEFYPPPDSVVAEAQYLIAYRTGAQPFDRQKTLHAALNVGGWLNARWPAGGPEPQQAPVEATDADLDAALKQIAEPAPEGAQAGLFDGAGGLLAGLLKKLLLELVAELLKGGAPA